MKSNILHADANDLQQEILLKLWKKLPSLDYQPERGKFRTWLYQVIRNHVYDYVKSKRFRNSQKDLPMDEQFQGASDSQLYAVMDEEWRAYVTSLAMQRIQNNFSKQNLEIFQALLKGATPKDLADTYGLKPNSISKVKNRIRERLIVEVAEVRKELE